MEMAYVSLYIGDQNKGKRDSGLKIMAERILAADEKAAVYVIGKNEWGSAFENRVNLSEKVSYEELKAVRDSIVFFDQESYSEQDKNIIRRICILAPMHENRVVVCLSDPDGEKEVDKTILKLCAHVYTADSSSVFPLTEQSKI